MTNPRSIPNTNWPWLLPGHTTAGAVRTGECNQEMPGLPYPAFRRVNAESGGGKPRAGAELLFKLCGFSQLLRGRGSQKVVPRLLRRVITFLFEDIIDVALSMQYPNHPNRSLVKEIINAHLLKTLDGPGS